MIKKMKFAFAPFLLLFVLGACSDNEDTATDDANAPETTEESAENAEQSTEPGEEGHGEDATNLDLPADDELIVVVNGEELYGNVYNSIARQLEASMAGQGQDVTDEETAESIKTQTIDVMVGNALIVQDAEEKGYEPDEETLDENMEEVKASFETEDELNEALERTGFTLDELRLQLREQMMYENYIAEEIEGTEVDDEEVQTAYDEISESSEDIPPFEEMETTIRQSLQEQKTQEALLERIAELRTDAEIDQKI
ncbi:MAG TPA: SurA N-terminal domain-containing protein [Planococcus sp. (in: firmicutes)]|nr:SurA N-terminal domain-containing protein [Planococcus sp. (in: firmicutes)]